LEALKVKPISLRWLIITPFFVLVLIAGVVMYLISSVTISKIADTIGEQYIEEVEHRIYERIQTFTAPLTDIVEINRDAFSSRPALLDDLIPIASRFYEQAIPYKHMTFISVATIHGRYLASSQDPLLKIQHNIAANFINKEQIMEGFEYSPTNFIGPKIETAPTFNYDPRVRPFYTDAVNAKGMVWSEIASYYGNPTLGVSLSAPIYNHQGKLLGVTATSIALIELDDYLDTIELVDNAYVFITEESGALIAASGDNQLYQENDGVYTRFNLNNHPNALFKLASQYPDSGLYELNDGDKEYLYHIHSIDLKYGKTWLIGTLIPTSYHKETLAAYTQTALFITLTIFVCMALMGSAIAWYIVKPIEMMNQAANDKKIESILMLPKPLSRIIEINSLNQALHSMAGNLLDTLKNLEKKVADRTSSLRDENQSLLENALTDELTGLYNRRGFNQAFSEAFENAKATNQNFSFAMGDIDHFKRINDKFGHAAGDIALISVANTLKKHIRFSKDIVARYGGEEFVLVFLNMSSNQVMKRLNKIQKAFSSTPAFDKQHITMSFGVVNIKDFPSFSAEMIIEEADKKLYQAKNSGRNKIIS
jgi:diguanylate cyclase (GGDEF)-like protein